MSRPIDWSPLAGSDPVPGEPELVERAGRHYRKVAVAINGAATKLRRIADGQDMQSMAVNAFRDSANKVAEDIGRAHERYDGVGQALSGYAPQLQYAQDESVAALRQAKEAEAAQASAHRAAEAAQGRIDSAKGADTTADQGDHRRALGAAEAAGGALGAARKRLQRAVEDRDNAAQRAINGINDVKDSGNLNDNWWDSWGAKVVKVVVKIADAVALAAGVLALAVGWIPVIGWGVAAVLGAVALGAGLVSLAGNVSLAATGKGEWSAALWSVAGVLSFGVGKAAVAGLRGTVRGTKYASQAARTASRPYGGNRAARSVARGYRQQSSSHGLLPKPAAFGREVRGAFNPGKALPNVRSSESVASVRNMARAHPNDPELARHFRNAQIQEEGIRLTNGYNNVELLKSGYTQGKEAVSSSPTEQLNLSKDGELTEPAGAGPRR